MADVHMRDLFAIDPQRFERYSLRCGDLFLDYSKNRVNDETMRLLVDLAESVDLAGWMQRMRSGDKINLSENRAVLHTALRNRSNTPVLVDGVDVMPEVNAVLAMPEVKEKLHAQFMEPIGGSTQDLASFMQQELRVMTPVIKRTGIKVD